MSGADPLVADCGSCDALCCVLVPFRAGDGFGADKESGVPCHHLQEDLRCGIHSTLRERGWSGCAVFDCFGAGQQVTQVTYADRSWREGTTDRGEMAAVLSVMRLLHESLHHLREVERRSPVPDATRLHQQVTELTARGPQDLLLIDLETLLAEVSETLRAASSRIRASRQGASLARRDLSGQDLRRTDLSGADLHGALLLAADLRRVDLTGADLLGADLRDADVRGADLSSALFLTRPQVAATRRDATTLLPAGYAEQD